jgi:hypothetical protein
LSRGLIKTANKDRPKPGPLRQASVFQEECDSTILTHCFLFVRETLRTE